MDVAVKAQHICRTPYSKWHKSMEAAEKSFFNSEKALFIMDIVTYFDTRAFHRPGPI